MSNYFQLPVEVRNLANEELGFSVLKYAMSAHRDYHLELKVENGALVGFAIYSQVGDTGYVDSLVVAKEFQGSGYGKMLLLKAVKALSLYGCSRAIIVFRRPPYTDGGNFEKSLTRVGFRSFAEKKQPYTNEDYQCQLCGEYPDACDAVYYQLPL